MTQTVFPFIKTSTGFTTLINNKPYNIVQSDNPKYSQLYSAVVAGDAEEFERVFNYDPSSMTMEEIISNSEVLSGAVEFNDGVVSYKGMELAGFEVNKIKSHAVEGLPYEPILRFIERRMMNPSVKGVADLYQFLEKNNLPLTVDGHFLAYKAVRPDFKDKHSGSIDNSVGAEIPPMRFEDVDPNKHNTCSHGYHVGAIEYSGPNGWFFGSGDHCMIVKVDPKNVVSVPADHNDQKMRVCHYEIVDEYKSNLATTLYDSDIKEVESSNEDFDSRVVERTKVSANNVRVGDYIEFTYRETKDIRTLYVTKIDKKNNLIVGEVLTNEMDIWDDIECTGEVKSFKRDRMRNVFQFVLPTEIEEDDDFDDDDYWGEDDWDESCDCGCNDEDRGY